MKMLKRRSLGGGGGGGGGGYSFNVLNLVEKVIHCPSIEKE